MQRASIAIAVLFLFAAATHAQHFAADRPVDVIHLRLAGRIDLVEQTFSGSATLDMQALRAIRTVRLNAVDLQVKDITLRGAGQGPGQPKTLKFANTGEELQIDLPRKLERGETFALHIRYSVHKPAKGLYFFKPSEAEPKVPHQAWTQGEMIETRHWIPITDQPNERLTSELKIVCDPKYDVLSNGRKLFEGEAEGLKVVHWKQEKPHVPYLITLVVGNFAILKEEWRGKELSYWVPPHRKADAMRSFGNTKRMMDFFSDRIGVDYPWHKYAQVVVEQFSWGGMENTGATTLNERTLHDERAQRDYSSDGLVAHELAHQWFGDLLTCKDWAHAWLNEGFATYFEALWSEHNKGDDHFRYNMFDKAKGARNGGKDKPIVWRHYQRPAQQFDGRAYPKGAWVLHMLRCQLGEEDWWRCVRHYVTKHSGQSVETDDLRIAFEEATGRSLERYFHDWTGRPGSPVVEVRHRWNAAKKVMEIRIRQTQKGDPFHFPLRLEYEVQGTMLGLDHDVNRKDESITLPLAARPDLVRIDPAYSVLMELKEHKANDWWKAQLARDPDPIARIRAAAHFGGIKRRAERLELIRAMGKDPFWGVRAEIAGALGRSGGDASRDALLTLLTEPDPKVRKATVDALGKFKNDTKVRDALGRIAIEGALSYPVEAAAITHWAAQKPANGVALLLPMLERDSHREQIRSAVLTGLGQQDDVAALDPLLTWTRRGKPRPCRVAALRGLGELAKTGHLDAKQTERIVAAAQACLHRLENRGIKSQASQLLRDAGSAAVPALPALEALAEHDPDNRVRENARKAIKRIEAGAPPHVQIAALRKALEATRDADRKLRERLEQLERKHAEPVK